MDYILPIRQSLENFRLKLNKFLADIQARLTTAEAHVRSGEGSPLGVVTAPVGTLYLRTDGGLLTTLYVKELGADADGWVAK